MKENNVKSIKNICHAFIIIVKKETIKWITCVGPPDSKLRLNIQPN